MNKPHKSDEFVVKRVKEFYMEHGRLPKTTEFHRIPNMISWSQFFRRFGGLGAFAEAHGVYSAEGAKKDDVNYDFEF